MYIDLPEKRYYKIGEVAKAFNVNTSHIRFWEKEFDILKPKKNKKGNRLFTQVDIKNLQIIYHLVKEKGFTLEGAKAKMKEKPKVIKDNFEIITRLENIKSELINIKNNLE
ncbi:MAG: MerR family transcriptional regulator [Lutibacter sp.]|jgi:DNA-binding transcriptional MerR regulator|uniref:MerR family transcriptional regulator n=1 Tax=Lutibacter sp. TaxID=1925666 RepID=UPI00299CEC11|nr:MerR family transcriptional regulator [Lutibacter sp.]MDX1828605.1 MerR family transcriptional regulator [Lutibacter sp.]